MHFFFFFFVCFATRHFILNFVKKAVNKQIFSPCNLGGFCSTGCSNLAQVFDVWRGYFFINHPSIVRGCTYIKQIFISLNKEAIRANFHLCTSNVRDQKKIKIKNNISFHGLVWSLRENPITYQLLIVCTYEFKDSSAPQINKWGRLS